MAIDFEDLIVNALLELCEEKALSRVTVKEILERSTVSKQTFYNHFKDKEDLIIYTFLSRVAPQFVEIDDKFSYYEARIATFRAFAAYHSFLKQALSISVQNCLRDFITEFCVRFDYDWLVRHRGGRPLTNEQTFASRYHSIACINMEIQWVLQDMPITPEAMAEQITDLQRFGLSPFMEEARYIYRV